MRDILKQVSAKEKLGHAFCI